MVKRRTTLATIKVDPQDARDALRQKAEAILARRLGRPWSKCAPELHAWLAQFRHDPHAREGAELVAAIRQAMNASGRGAVALVIDRYADDLETIAFHLSQALPSPGRGRGRPLSARSEIVRAFDVPFEKCPLPKPTARDLACLYIALVVSETDEWPTWRVGLGDTAALVAERTIKAEAETMERFRSRHGRSAWLNEFSERLRPNVVALRG